MESTFRYEREDGGSIPSGGSKIMKKHIFKINDKVRVPKWMAVSGRYNRGVITYKNGANLIIKLNYKSVECHLYTTEVIAGWR